MGFSGLLLLQIIADVERDIGDLVVDNGGVIIPAVYHTGQTDGSSPTYSRRLDSLISSNIRVEMEV